MNVMSGAENLERKVGQTFLSAMTGSGRQERLPHRSRVFAFCASALFLLLHTFAEEPETTELTPQRKAAIAQEKGIVAGAFTAWNRGIRLPAKSRVLVIPVNDETSKTGMMDEWQALFVRRRLKMAEREKFDLVVLEINSPGGLADACKQMIDDVQKSKVPVIAYVKDKALSAGALLALGTKLVVMQPNTQIGAAKVVLFGGDFSTAMRQKVDGAMAAYVRDLCSQNGYPHALCEGFVDSSIEVIETDDVNQRFMTDSEFAFAEKRGANPVRTWKKKDQILTLTASEARSTGLAAGIAADMDELMLGVGMPGTASSQFTVTREDITLSEKTARFMSSPWWRVAFVVVGLIMLFLELKSPGHGFGYAGFAVCMGMFFWLQVFQQNAGVVELLLFGIGSVLVAVEVFILPTFGLLGFAGVVAVLVSIVLAFLPEGTFSGLLGTSGKPPEYVMNQIVDGMLWASLTLMSVMGFFVMLWWKGVKIPGISKLSLQTVNAGSVGGTESERVLPVLAPQSDAASLSFVGKIGVADTVLRPAGKVRLEGRTIDAMSEGDFIAAGTSVRVLRWQGSTLVVRAETAG